MCENTEDMMNMDEETISHFFAGKNVFLTGATGFIGKALMEKLIRSCPDIGTLYILVRPKRGNSLQDRLKQLMAEPLFDRVKNEQSPDIIQSKIHVIAGDISQINLGISEDDQKLLIENVHVIFHVAASIRFHDPLEVATKLNLRPTRDICLMALKMKQLKAYVHVSTAYANCYQETSKEILYKPQFQWEKLITMAETMEPAALEKMWSKMRNQFQNTYCFTKNLAEHCVNELCNNKIPVILYRPALVQYMVTPDPIIGWVDNYNGLTAIMLSSIIGILRSINANNSTTVNQVPVDMVTKSLIVSAWDIATHGKKSKDIDIVHCSSEGIEWLRPSLGKLFSSIKEVNEKEPMVKAIWTPNFPFIKSTIFNEIYAFLFMIIPFYFFDFIRVISGRKARLYKYVRKARRLQATGKYFFLNTFYFENKKFYEMRNRILKSDLKIWDYDYHNISTQEEFLNLGGVSLRKYLLKVPDNDIEKIRKHNFKMYLLDFVFKTVIYVGILYYFSQIIKVW